MYHIKNNKYKLILKRSRRKVKMKKMVIKERKYSKIIKKSNYKRDTKSILR